MDYSRDPIVYQKRLNSFKPDSSGIEIVYTDNDQGQVSFHGQQSEAVHQWYRLTAAYSPTLVRRCFDMFGDDIDAVLDPFAGTGTTLVEAKKHGYDAYGVEFNPIYTDVATAKTTWDLDLERLDRQVGQLFKTSIQIKSRWANIALDRLPAETGVTLPDIYNRERWWDDAVLRDLLAIREAIPQVTDDEQYRRFFRVALASILIDVSNATYDHVSLSFMDESPEGVDALGAFKNQFNEMLADLCTVRDRDSIGTATVIKGDSTDLGEYIETGAANMVITSPPYPNRYSYLRETRPHLFFFDEIDGADEVGEMALKSIGGTWGKATSTLEDADIQPTNDHIASLIGDIVSEIEAVDGAMANYTCKYFNKMEHHLQGVDEVLPDTEAAVAYTVGNSILKGVEVPTDILLARMFQHHGFGDLLITRERSRNSKEGLYEATVYATRSDP